jgi:hypothetical protein
MNIAMGAPSGLATASIEYISGAKIKQKAKEQANRLDNQNRKPTIYY